MRVRLVALGRLTLVAAWLRFTATDFGTPGTFRPDKEYMLYSALGFEDD